MRFALLWVAIVATASPAFAEDDLAMAWERSRALEHGGDLRAAADALTSVAERYPDEHDLWLQIAWLRFRSEDYERAEPAYRRAAELSGAALPLAGLGWTLLRLDRREEARMAFDQALSIDPELASAHEGLEAWATTAPSRFRAHARLWVVTHRYRAHPGKDRAYSLAPQLTLDLPGDVRIAATYRFSRFENEITTMMGMGVGPGPGGATTTQQTFVQHDGVISLGVWKPRWGLLGHWGRSSDTSSLLDLVHVIGLTLRASPERLGDLSIEAAVAIYEDTEAWRIAPSWRIPLCPCFSLVPHGAIQLLDGKTFGMGGLRAVFTHARADVWMGGTAGNDRRPMRLDIPVVFNTADRYRGSVEAGLRIALHPSIAMYATYDWQRLEAANLTEAGDTEWRRADAHFVSLGLGGSIP